MMTQQQRPHSSEKFETINPSLARIRRDTAIEDIARVLTFEQAVNILADWQGWSAALREYLQEGVDLASGKRNS